MNPVSSSLFIQSTNPQVKIAMACLCQKIKSIFIEKSLDKTVHLLIFTKDLLKLKKQETEEKTIRTLTLSKYGSFFDEKTAKFFASLLHKLPASPMEIGVEYIRKAPGHESVKGFQVSGNWEKEETVTLDRIYKNQLFAWICKNSWQSFDCILLLTKLLQSFDDFSIRLDDKIWDEILLLTEQETLKEFQSKYQFLMEYKFLQLFPIDLETVMITRDIHKTIHNQFRLYDKAFTWLKCLAHVKQMNSLASSLTKKNPWEIFSDKTLTHKLKKDLSGVQREIKSFIDYFDKGKRSEEENNKDRASIKILEERERAMRDYLRAVCREKRGLKVQSTSHNSQKESAEGNIYHLLKDLIDQMSELNREIGNLEKDKTIEPKIRDREIDCLILSRTKTDQEMACIIEEKVNSLAALQEVKRFFNDQIKITQERASFFEGRIFKDYLYIYKEEFCLSYLLMDYISYCTFKKRVQFKEKRETLSSDQFDEMLEKEFESLGRKLKHKPSNSKAQVHVPKTLDREKLAQSVASLASDPLHEIHPLLNKDLVQTYLESKEEEKQLNGCLSQKIENYLEKQIKPLLNQEQGKEVYDHTLLGVSALEYMAQAVYEGRRDHVVLGFRSLLIHCYFSVEQMLCQKILQSTGVIANSHSLNDLANQLEGDLVFSKEEQDFFQEKIHLWFRYPEDYKLRFKDKNERRLQQGKKITPFPKALSLLSDLSMSEISIESLQEAIVFSFAKYCEALELIAKLSGAPISSIIEFRRDINSLQNQLLGSEKLKEKDFVKPMPLLHEIEKAKITLSALENFDQVKDLEDGELLAAFDTIKNYLQYMEISLKTPQKSVAHSLQKFLQVETLLNVDKLFKHLFRAISILHLEEDNRTHNLDKFYLIIDSFYKESLSAKDKKLLNRINLNITHHYFHRKSSADLKRNYDRFLRNAIILSSVSEGFTLVTSDGEISSKILQEEEKTIMDAVLSSLKIFNQILPRVISSIEKINGEKLKIG